MKKAVSFVRRIVDLTLVACLVIVFFYLIDLYAGKRYGLVRTVNHTVNSVISYFK